MHVDTKTSAPSIFFIEFYISVINSQLLKFSSIHFFRYFFYISGVVPSLRIAFVVDYQSVTDYSKRVQIIFTIWRNLIKTIIKCNLMFWIHACVGGSFANACIECWGIQLNGTYIYWSTDPCLVHLFIYKPKRTTLLFSTNSHWHR